MLRDLKSILSRPIRPSIPRSDAYRPASVLVVIYGQKPTIIMIKKSKRMRSHAGEIAFPGGKTDGDLDMLETALRETKEEIGLSLTRDDVVGQLESVVTLNSGFLIVPFMSVIDSIPRLEANSEVDEILHIPLEPFLQTMEDDSDPFHNSMSAMYAFRYGDRVVWGASARILAQIKDIVAGCAGA